VVAEWTPLLGRTQSPFLTRAWLEAWWRAFGRGEPVSVALRDADGTLAAGAVLTRGRARGLSTPVDDHTGRWDVVARDEAARAEVLRALAGLEAPVVTLGNLLDDDAAAAEAALRSAGRRTHVSPGPESPYLELPGSFDELLGGLSRNLRSQVGRRRRGLEKQGRLVFRTTTGGPDLERDLDALLRVEASGWKARAGTAILSDERTERLYREFARALAEDGQLRLHLLELDGEAIAGDLGAAVEGCESLVKTGFDEAHERLAPGLVLRAEVLRAAIEEGRRTYDFLGGPDGYKMRWTSTVRPHVTVRGFRGVAAAAPETYRRLVRPALVRGRDLAQQARARAKASA
jgi:CelD/BcsL family acetyltransferase involved in cellulose biosynthesis